jgi:NAD(P)-dependent dehydrogenase (short-subunit alcohol dehydrogenase family)
MASLDGKVYAITGGASGIGFATAKILARRGATVCIGDVDPDAMQQAGAFFTEQQSRHSVTRVDVSDRAQVDSWIEGIVAQFGRLDGAANVAGIIGKHHGSRPVAELDDDEWHRIMAVNLTGCMYCMRAELRHVSDGGSIVNVSSIHGTRGACSQPAVYIGQCMLT